MMQINDLLNQNKCFNCLATSRHLSIGAFGNCRACSFYCAVHQCGALSSNRASSNNNKFAKSAGVIGRSLENAFHVHRDIKVADDNGEICQTSRPAVRTDPFLHAGSVPKSLSVMQSLPRSAHNHYIGDRCQGWFRACQTLLSVNKHETVHLS